MELHSLSSPHRKQEGCEFSRRMERSSYCGAWTRRASCVSRSMEVDMSEIVPQSPKPDCVLGMAAVPRNRVKNLAKLCASFLLGAVLSAGVCFYFFSRARRTVAHEAQSLSLPSLPTPLSAPTTALLFAPLPNGVPDTRNIGPTSAAASSAAPALSTTDVSLQPKHVTENDGQCALLTKEELSQILGTNLTEVTSDSTGCNYKGSGRGNWVRYEITWKGGREALEQRRSAYETLKRRLAPTDMPLQLVPNLGDEAYMTLTGTLHVRKGDVAVLFNLMWFQGLPVEKTKLLVDTAFARLE